MGAGAVGGYFGARLQEAGEEVVFCARGENLRAMKEHGLSVESFRGDLRLEKVSRDRRSARVRSLRLDTVLRQGV